MEKIAVGILGATGWIGQQYIHLLHHHPLFEATVVMGRDVGYYDEIVAPLWQFPEPPPHLKMTAYENTEPLRKCPIVFSALPSSYAFLDREVAQYSLVITHNANLRQDPTVPLVIPEVNGSLLIESLLQQRLSKQGGLIAKPNCVVIPLVLTLNPFLPFGLKEVRVTSLQSISGAGFHGLSALSIQDTILPDIPGEKEKIENEPHKIWNQMIPITAHTFRVPVKTHHTLSISFSLNTPLSLDEIQAMWKAPVFYQAYKPYAFNPMHVICSHLTKENSWYHVVCVSHNGILGGAGSGLSIATRIYKEGLCSVVYN